MPDRNLQRRKWLSAAFLVLVLMFIGAVPANRLMKISRAREIASKAGPADVVCREAQAFFDRFGTSDLRFYPDWVLKDPAVTFAPQEPSNRYVPRIVPTTELRAFPAIERFGSVDGCFGSVDGIWGDDNPPRIKTRQYTEFDHFIVDIVRAEDADRYRSVFGESILEQVGPCVFARE